MNPQEIYTSFVQLLNKNSTNKNISVPKGVFVKLWNREKRQWLDDKTKGKENSNYIDDLEELLEVDAGLDLIKSYSNKDTFALPSNFFRRVSSYIMAENGECNNKKLVNWVVKPKDLEVLLMNSDYEPSFDWEETLSILSKNNIIVHKKDFKIKEVYLTYYREPLDLDIEGYIHSDGTPSKNITVDLDIFNIEEITGRAVLAAMENYENVEGIQVASSRIKRNESII